MFDVDQAKAVIVAKELKTNAFESLEDLISNVDAVSIVTPTPTHVDVAKRCVTNERHVFIEKPIATTTRGGGSDYTSTKKHKTIVQVGHIERFNPALLALSGLDITPKYIEVHRMAPFMAAAQMSQSSLI